jgi:ligand-binding SRPBCC domain-containing protein
LRQAVKIYRLHRRQFLPVRPETAWPFFSSPRNLDGITPSFLRFEITSDVPAELYDGLIISYRISAVAGIPMTWITEVKHVAAPCRFVDEQRLGPFRFWYHEHRFTAVENGMEMEDTIHYVMPWGWLGRVIHWLFISKRLRSIFDFRRDVLVRRWPA